MIEDRNVFWANWMYWAGSVLQLAQRVPELSAANYGQRDVDFSSMEVWDQDVMDLLDAQDLDKIQALEDESDNFEVVNDEDILDEVSLS